MKQVKLMLAFAAMLSVLVACGGSQPVIDETSTADQNAADAMGAGDNDGIDSDSDNGNSDAEAALSTVFYFDYDRSTLTYETRQALDKHSEMLRDSSRVIRLEGHADDRGTREYNLALGEKRAKSIADYMVLQGVSRSQIEPISYGEEKPIAFSQDEQSYRLNRRVELK